MMDTTLDHLLNKRVVIEQPAEGYRIAVDTVLLAAAVPAQTGQKVLDMGCGVGGAMLCLAARVPDIHIIGVDIQEELVEICRRNSERNKFVLAQALTGDATRIPEACHLSPDFDHVLMNPPYHEEARHSVSGNKSKRTANAEKTGDLALWLAAAARVLKPNGLLTLIHRADRQDDIVDEAAKSFGVVDILPIIAREAAVPKRIILRLQKGSGVKVNTCKNFILYGPNGRYNDAAESVIRHGHALKFE